ncbi:T9SS type A sorting domain-containing protein [Hymenobacter monticola]|uniref:T9SS type A sorting domain-containing protein n=1 Tax=Hymenobacter monticola TaxID=1705399 RepID=A0ABY4B8S4_9BACT|nr:T9SS type A sorting domain-containing protein [Hymenobacter monticola]UOE35573.1 T9SS type A sorting domain-containing protein [Hymenobacter monticola]
MKHFFTLACGSPLACLLLLLLVGPAAFAQAPAWQMALTINQSGSQFGVPPQVSATATDASGNVYITGTYSGTASFGSITLTSVTPYLTVGNTSFNETDAFVAKWSPVSNSFVWAQSAGGGGYDGASAIAVVGTSVYITGAFTGPTAAFGSTTLANTNNTGTSPGSYNGTDVFVAKLIDLGASASFAWAQRASGTSNEGATGIAVDGSNVYVAGWFSASTVVFGATTLTNASVAGSTFVAKLADNGATANFVWAQQSSGLGGNVAVALAVSGSSVYVTGGFNGPTATFGPFTLTNANPATGIYGNRTDIFVAKLTDAGPTSSFTWAQQAGGIGFDVPKALAVNGANVYIAGYYGSTRYSVGGPLGNTPSTFGNTSLPSIGDYDAFVAKLTDAGATASFAWAQRAGGADMDSATAITVQGSNVYVAGTFRSSQISFGATTLTRPSANGSYPRDVFVAKLVDAGSSSRFDWAQQAGGSADDFATSVRVARGSVYVGGTVGPIASFGSQTINTSTSSACFLASLTDPTLTATAAARGNLSFSLSPNPARSTATVQLPAVPGATSAILTLTDALGRTLRTETLSLSTSQRHELNLRGLAPGLYALRVSAGPATATRWLTVE